MKRLAPVLLLMLAFPSAVLADTSDFTTVNGQLTGSNLGLHLDASLIAINGFTGFNLGTIIFSIGKLKAGTGTLIGGALFESTNSSFTITLTNAAGGFPGGIIFVGTFTSDINWTPVPGQAGFYTLEGSISGTLKTQGHIIKTTSVAGFTSQVYFVTFGHNDTQLNLSTVGSGDTFLTPSVPEPGTLSLLGTGFAVLPAVFRRRRQSLTGQSER